VLIIALDALPSPVVEALEHVDLVFQDMDDVARSPADRVVVLQAQAATD
jgi:hypothetical protein